MKKRHSKSALVSQAFSTAKAQQEQRRKVKRAEKIQRRKEER